MDQKEVYPRGEIADPPGTVAVLLFGRYVFAEVWCLFIHCVMCNRRR